jgi:hypothetical protein
MQVMMNLSMALSRLEAAEGAPDLTIQIYKVQFTKIKHLCYVLYQIKQIFASRTSNIFKFLKQIKKEYFFYLLCANSLL